MAMEKLFLAIYDWSFSIFKSAFDCSLSRVVMLMLFHANVFGDGLLISHFQPINLSLNLSFGQFEQLLCFGFVPIN